MLKRLIRGLPWTGLGWSGGPDPDIGRVRSWAARERAALLPLPVRAVVPLADRLAWTVAAVAPTLRFARAAGLGPDRIIGIYSDCVRSGGRPLEVHVWRATHGGLHPFPARSAGLVLSRLGDPAAHAILADKLACAERLGPCGIAFPRLVARFRRGDPLDLHILERACAEGPLFLKPRHGHGGQGSFAVSRVDGSWSVDGRATPERELRARLSRTLRHDDMIVQERLESAAPLEDLSSDARPPVLRIATACLPGGRPFIQSALLVIPVPGRSTRHFLDGAIHAPVDMATGRLAAGVSLRNPASAISRLGWNGAQLTGRDVPGFQAAAELASRAMSALPPLPLVHWDMVLTADGPVLLEGNTAGNWILACLPERAGLSSTPPGPVLVAWTCQPPG